MLDNRINELFERLHNPTVIHAMQNTVDLVEIVVNIRNVQLNMLKVATVLYPFINKTTETKPTKLLH